MVFFHQQETSGGSGELRRQLSHLHSLRRIAAILVEVVWEGPALPAGGADRRRTAAGVN